MTSHPHLSHNTRRMYLLRVPPALAALGWPFIVAAVASTVAASASISSSSSSMTAFAFLHLSPVCLVAAVAFILFLIVRLSSPTPGPPLMLHFLLHSASVSARLACVALYFIFNIMHYVPLVVATCPVSSLPPPSTRDALFSILPVTVFLTPILLFFINNTGLFLLGRHNFTLPPDAIDVSIRSQFSTLLTHEILVLTSVARDGKPCSFLTCLHHVYAGLKRLVHSVSSVNPS
jgi:hypothetical protein